MAQNGYITLGDYDGINNKKKFVVLMGSWKPNREKTQTRKRSITGSADTQEGYIVKMWSMTIKVKYQVTDSSYGTLADLKAFFDRNGTSGSASGRLTFTEFDDTQVHKVEMLGSLSEDNIIPMLTGTEAEFYVPIILEKVD